MPHSHLFGQVVHSGLFFANEIALCVQQVAITLSRHAEVQLLAGAGHWVKTISVQFGLQCQAALFRTVVVGLRANQYIAVAHVLRSLVQSGRVIIPAAVVLLDWAVIALVENNTQRIYDVDILTLILHVYRA